MKKIALFLAVVLMLPCFSSCKKSKKESFSGKTISSESTWWNETMTTVTPDEIKKSREGSFYNVFSSHAFSDEDSAILRFSLSPDDTDQQEIEILRHYSYDGKLLGQIILNDHLKADDLFSDWEVFSRGGKYYAQIEDSDSGDQMAYELDFENSTLKDPVPLNYPELGDGYFSSVNTMIGVGDSLVYLIHDGDDGKSTYQVYVDDGSSPHTFDLDFGRDVQVGTISSFCGTGGNTVSFTAEVSENGITREYSCTLDIASFEFKKTPVQNPDGLSNLFFTSEGKALSCGTHQVFTLDVATGTKSEFLNFNNTYVLGNFAGAQILHATDSEIVLFREDQNSFGMNSTAHLVKLTKADKNPNAGRKALVIAHFQDLGDAEYNAVNEFNTGSSEYFVEVTDKYFDIANASDDSSGVSVLAQQLKGEVNAMDLLISDIKSGTGPDLILFDSQFEKLNNTSYLIDLSDRIKSEESLRSGDYMDFVLSPNGRDGKHYRLNYKYMYDGFCVNKNFLDDGAKGLTFSEYDRIIKENNLGKSVLYKDDLSLLKELVRSSDCFSYDESGKLSLNTENFRAIAEYIASIPDSISYDDGLLGLTNVNMLHYMSADGFANQYGALNETHTIIGMPSPDGHAETINGFGIGITSTCSAQDGAWEFAMKLLSPEAQRSISGGDPVMKSALKEHLLEIVQQFNDQKKVFYEPERLTDEYADWYIGQLSDAVIVPDINPTVLMIMCEEMPAYFAGDKTLDEVISTIENRINLLLREQG